MVTHSKDEASFLCSYIALISKGQIIKTGQTTELFENPQSIEAAKILGCKNLHKAEKAGEFAVRIPELGIVINTEKPVADNVSFAGFRDDAFVML
jgi:molybdate transport system ATP-binding protein